MLSTTNKLHKQVVGELWRPAGGAYNVDNVLKVMVKGLEHELQARLDGKQLNSMAGNYPSPAIDAEFMKQAKRKIRSANSNVPATMDAKDIHHQGADISIPFRHAIRWISRRYKARRQASKATNN